jgi:hypothetical protein
LRVTREREPFDFPAKLSRLAETLKVVGHG